MTVAFNEPAKKHLGQNFLHERSVIDKIVQAVNPQPGDRLVEIGPGPFVTSTPELARALERALEDPKGHSDEYAERYDHFLEHFCGREDGHASERAVEALLTGGQPDGAAHPTAPVEVRS